MAAADQPPPLSGIMIGSRLVRSDFHHSFYVLLCIAPTHHGTGSEPGPAVGAPLVAAFPAIVFLRGVARPTATELEHLLRASLTTDVSGVAAGRVAEVNAHGSDPTLVAHQRRTARHTFALARGKGSLDYVRVIGFLF